MVSQTDIEQDLEVQCVDSIKAQPQVLEGFELTTLACLWYLSSSFANNFNKSILRETMFPYPLTLTFFQFGFIAVCVWIIFQLFPNKFKRKVLHTNSLAELVIPLCISLIAAHWLTQISLQQVPVSFTNTVKATAPIFSITLSRYYNFKEKYTPLLLFSIVPIITGVILCSFTETDYTFLGFITALLSTMIFAWQATFSKKVFRDTDMDQMNLLFLTSVFSFTLLLPVWFLVDFPYFSFPSDLDKSLKLMLLFFLDGTCHFLQNVTALSFMARVMPLTYTIFNTFKRVCVIVLSIIYFGQEIKFANAVGIALAVLGVGLYNKAKLEASNHST